MDVTRERDHKTEWQRRKDVVRAKAHELRDKLRKLLGNKCSACGEKDNLTFEHPQGREYKIRDVNYAQRMRLYLRDYLRGNLILLCGGCNFSAGAAYGCHLRAQARSRQ